MIHGIIQVNQQPMILQRILIHYSKI